MTEQTPDKPAAADAPKADPAMFSDCGDTPCPQPVLTDPQNEAAALAEGVRMRDNPAEWAFVRLSKLIEEFEANLDKDEEIGAWSACRATGRCRSWTSASGGRT